MSSTYNTRPLAPEILVDGARHTVIRRRQAYKDLIAMDHLPAGWRKTRPRPARGRVQRKRKKLRRPR